jgi:hypothetical protein
VTRDKQRETGNAFFGLCDLTQHLRQGDITQLLQQLTEGDEMLTHTQIEIAVRLYENQAYGSTYGKGLYRKAVFNGTIDAKSPRVKYVVDFYDYEDWCNLAKTDEQMVILDAVPQDKKMLFSWIYRYDLVCKTKTLVHGVVRMDLTTMDLDVLICDESAGVADRWHITAKPCKASTSGVNSPQLLATNTELASW